MLSNPRIDLITNENSILSKVKGWAKAFAIATGYVIFGITILSFWIALSN